MAQTCIKLKDGTTINVDGSVQEVLKILAMYPVSSDVESISSLGLNVGLPTSTSTPAVQLTKNQKALAWAKAQIGRYVQTCRTPGCKYNYDKSGAMSCSTPNPRADADDIQKENQENYHPFWNFYCMRFVRSTYNGPAEYAKAEDMYQALSKAGKINTDHNIPEGALVFWYWSTYGHIGIYSGNGKVIHTGVNPATKKNGIRESLVADVTEVLDGYNHYQAPRTSYLGWADPPENWTG
ncbi:MAG: NlpC/P60 family protein [Candidatus Paceibacterota bacterium]|jgi:cell wall-associated NlpC family hydrolase